MDVSSKKNLYAICSWVETYSDEIAQEASDVFFTLLERKVEDYSQKTNTGEAAKKALIDLKNSLENDAYSFLTKGVRGEEEPRTIGFGYYMEQMEKQELLAESVREVKKKGLLANTLNLLRQEDLPLSEDEKIIMLLQTPQNLPEYHQYSLAKISCPVKLKRAGRAKNVEIPVKVVFAGGRVKEILSLDYQKQYD